MKTRTLLIVVASLTLALAGCSKGAKGGSGGSDLGVVEVSDGVEIQRDLGKGAMCTIIPTVQKDGTVLLSMKVLQNGKVVTSPSIQTAPDQHASITVGDISIGITPHVKR